jgi:hypothetical protein
MNETISFVENYGPVKTDIRYRLVNKGYDYVAIICQGKLMYVPIAFVEKYERRRKKYEDLPTYEEIMAAEEE